VIEAFGLGTREQSEELEGALLQRRWQKELIFRLMFLRLRKARSTTAGHL